MISAIIDRIRAEMAVAFLALDNWCNAKDDLLEYKPPQGWTIKEILEHITLTNHFLLLIIRKGTTKALHRAGSKDISAALSNYVFDWEKLGSIGEHGSFPWIRPEHMEPTGNVTLQEIRNRLSDQLMQCTNHLNALKNGEGIMYKVTMSVNNIGKIDMYHYIYFLVQHINRHLIQMEKIRSNIL